MTEPQATTEVPKDNETPEPTKKATNLIIVGMAGSGKTTFMQRITSNMANQERPPYVINLDPAVADLQFPTNIDIRDTVKYKEVMKQYGLGPNGAIITSLNLFATRFDQVLQLLEKRQNSVKYVLIDTPGQIEVFNWSASGTIISESLASVGPTVLLYIIDTPRSTNPTTFMSNMLYACSIPYKNKLPLIVVFNKTDVARMDFAVDWMTDFEKFQDASDVDTTFMASLTKSMSLVLDEFYKNLKTVGVSAMTGDGVEELLAAIDEAAVEYESSSMAKMKEKLDQHKKQQEEEQEENRQRFQADFEQDTKE